MTKKQLIDTCCQLRPSARDWRAAVERHVNYFAGYAGFDFKNWEKGKYIEARAIAAALCEKMARYHIYGHSDPKVQRKLKKICRLMHAII